MNLPKVALELCSKLIDSGAYPVIVGGYVRDFFMGKKSKDIDIEVYGINSLDDLKTSLQSLAPVYEVGKHFGVLKIKLDGYDFDISLPRTEKKTAKGHKGFSVKTDGSLNFKAASMRRDFTMNAMGYDVMQKSFLDPFNGKKDIDDRIIRHVNDESFVEDPLRVLRAAQFAARFDYKLHTNTLKLCQTMVKQKMLLELPRERVFEEYKKLLLKAPRPSIGFNILDETGALFPELKMLQGVIQDKIYHPEGDVWTHTMMSLDAMAALKTGETKRDLVLLLAILCHDLAKAQTTKIVDGKVSSIGHENILEPTLSLLARLSNEKSLINAIIPLIQQHLMPSQLYNQKAKDPAIRRLATKVNIEDLVILSKADHLGRTTQDAVDKNFPAEDWLLEKSKELRVHNKKASPILQGRHLIAAGIPAGVAFKKILDEAYEAQMDGKIIDEKSGLEWLSQR